IQLAAAMQLQPHDYVYPYYRDESILLGIGMTPEQMMLQLLAKKDDPFSAGRMYYAHPSLRDDDKPKIPFQSSATGMQAIPSTGAAHGLKYMELAGIGDWEADNPPIVVCSLGDGSVTEGEVSEAFQMAILKELPIVYLIQDNDWGISARGNEMRKMDAVEFAAGFPGLDTVRIENGSDFMDCYRTLNKVYATVRKERRPMLVHAEVPLLNHHTSGVRKEFYRSDEELGKLTARDPITHLRARLLDIGIDSGALTNIEDEAKTECEQAFENAKAAAEPTAEDLTTHVFAPTPVTEEKGVRAPDGAEPIVMVDAGLHAMKEIFEAHPGSLLYGQDVGALLGGVFREAATLGKKYGDNRVFNTPIQEAYIIGSTAGMSAVGCKPVVEVQFADYIWPGINQLFTELSRSCYLSAGKWPVQSLIRVPIGAYGGGGPYHSSSVESVLANIRGIKVVYPSTAADFKGLFKAAFYDPNPVVILEHKGLYWSKVPGTQAAKTPEPDADYVIPIGKARTVLTPENENVEMGDSIGVIAYGMGVYWAMNAANEELKGKVELLDLRSIVPYDWDAIQALVERHGKLLIVTEEPVQNSFAEALSGRISRECFQQLDAPVQVVGSVNVPGIPVNDGLEAAYLPGKAGVAEAMQALISY
ncbi:MAG: alpha-ketoacid dehydrogenase subunit alpha/beta, partial [Bacteroidota bacterium]